MATSKVAIILEAKDRASREIRNADGGLNKLKATARGAAIALAAVTTATTLLVRETIKLAKRGGEVVSVGTAFNRLMEGEVNVMGRVREATRGLISDFELMRQANMAIALGSARNAEEFATLAEVATTLGRALGLDTAFAVNSLNVGIARQSRLVLDNLGIIVDVESANRQYAASLGVAADALSDNQRREAFRTAAMESARKKMEDVGGIVETNADNVQRMAVAWRNANDAIATFVAQSPTLTRALDTIAGSADKITEAFTDQGFLNSLAIMTAGLPVIGPAMRGLRNEMAEARAAAAGGGTIGPVTQPGFRPAAPSIPGAGIAVPGAPGLSVPFNVGAGAGLGSMAGRLAAPGAIPFAISGPGAHGLTPPAPSAMTAAQIAMAGAGVPEGFGGVDALNEVEDTFDGMNAEAMAAVGSLHALGLAAIDGSLGIDDLTASIANIAATAVGGVGGALIGAVSGIVLSGLLSDNEPMPVRVSEYSSRAQSQMKDAQTEPDIQVHINGAEATQEQLRDLGYNLTRTSRLRGESIIGE